MNPGLYIVGTPIGNLKDISIRAIETLKEADFIYAEDTRHTKKLIFHYDIHNQLISYYKFNEAKRINEIIKKIKNGASVVLVCDSGMPGISDPGAKLIKACRDSNISITSIPGPSAVTTAISLSGLGDDGFIFAGFLPHKSGGRARELKRWSNQKLPVVFYESPYRLIKLMKEIEEHISPNREVFIARELTKKFEETLHGNPNEIQLAFQQRRVKGELVVILYPAS